MKKRIYSKKTKKPLKKTKSKTFKKKTKNMMKKKHLKKKTKIKSTRKTNKSKKQMKKVMKGGAFSELNPSTVMEHTFHGVTDRMSGSLSDTAQSVPNNLSSGPSIFDQPYLDATSDGTLNVAGDSPDTHFATPNFV